MTETITPTETLPCEWDDPGSEFCLNHRTHCPHPEQDDERECPWCQEPITDDDGTDFCGRRGETMHYVCHRTEAECSCR